MPDLPPLNIVVTRVELPDAVMATYKTLQRELFAALEERTIEASSPLVATGKCAQLANGFLYDEGNEDPVEVHTVKIDWLRELVESLDGEPLLIAYEFIEDLRTIRRAFGEVPALGGLTPAGEAKRLVEAWNAGDAAAARLPSGVGRARAQSPAWRIAHGVAVAKLVGRTHRAGDRADLSARADPACDHSRLRRRRHRRRDEARPGARQDERAGSVQATSGAGLMQARTAFRLAMLRNGFWPLLNDCKRAIEPGWPKRCPDETEVLSWDRSALTSTGLKIDGDLAVIDVDVSEAAFVDALASAFDQSFPELFARGLVRHAGGPKEAWIARVDEPFRRLASRRWYRGSDPDDPAVPKHLVECFGSRGTRQFAIDGPHARDRHGEVISAYQFAGGASPATTPRASLPVLPKAAYALACDLFDGIAAAAGLTAVKEARRGRGEATPMCFELDADTGDRDARLRHDDGRRA